MAQNDAPFAVFPPLENTPPQDPYSMPMTVNPLVENTDDSEDWEYEYSTTETEVCKFLPPIFLNGS